MKKTAFSTATIVALIFIISVCVSAHSETVDSVVAMIDTTMEISSSISGYTAMSLEAEITSGDYTADVSYISDGYYDAVNDGAAHIGTASAMTSDDDVWYISRDLYATPSDYGYTISENIVDDNGERWQYSETDADVINLDLKWELDDAICDDLGDDMTYYRLFTVEDGVQINLFINTETEDLGMIHIEAVEDIDEEKATEMMGELGFSDYDTCEIKDFSFDCNMFYNAVEAIDLPSEVK